jgi:hypothetical protein
MNNSPSYQAHFYDLLKERNLTTTQLPSNLQQLITAYESAEQRFNNTDKENRLIYLDALITSDALISALVFQQSNEATTEIPTEKTSNAKLKELKIKALKLKYNLSQLKNT